MSDEVFRATIDDLPHAIMLCNLETFTIEYANKRSMALLARLRHLLPVGPDDIVGTSIDVFHKDPGFQRALLSDRANLPHSARIILAGEILDLHVTPVATKDGARQAALTWNVVTEAVAAERETSRLLQMIDKMPINVMTCDPADWRINYINRTGLDTLRSIEAHLPVEAKHVLGSSIDIFHRTPVHQRELLSDPANLPRVANIKLGPEALRLEASPIIDDEGRYLGPMLTWSVETASTAMANSVTEAVARISAMSADMSQAAAALLDASHNAAGEVTSVSAAKEQLTQSIEEISGQMGRISDTSRLTLNEAGDIETRVGELAAAADSIGSITSLINSIAKQTDLLALNAAIEAARAGEVGKSFGVVASEVKDLAKRTSAAADDIRDSVGHIQETTAAAVRAMQRISGSIEAMERASVEVVAAVLQQNGAIRGIGENIDNVSSASRETGTAAETVQSMAADLALHATELQAHAARFFERMAS